MEDVSIKITNENYAISHKVSKQTNKKQTLLSKFVVFSHLSQNLGSFKLFCKILYLNIFLLKNIYEIRLKSYLYKQ